MNIKLLSFNKYTGLADFEVNEVTCHATVNLEDFVIGEQIIKPHQWYDMNEEYIPKPKWFKRKELFELNNVFEDSFRDFIK